VFTALLFIKRIMLSRNVRKLNAYIKNSETLLSERSGMKIGWSNHWSEQKNNRFLHRKGYMTWWGNIYWVILFFSNTALAAFFPFKEVMAS